MLLFKPFSWLLFKPSICRFDLGDAAPQANGVKVYSSDEADEEIILEVDFSWVSSILPEEGGGEFGRNGHICMTATKPHLHI